MDLLKKFWPLSFRVVKGSYKTFYISFFVYVVVCFLMERLANIAAPVQVLGTVLNVLYICVDVYSVVGVVLCVCQLFGVIKKS